MVGSVMITLPPPPKKKGRGRGRDMRQAKPKWCSLLICYLNVLDDLKSTTTNGYRGWGQYRFLCFA